MKTIYLATLPKREVYHYEFTCPHCNTKILLATGVGRYGNLGGFGCTDCGTEYYATIDDHPRPKLSLTLTGNSPQAISAGTLTR